MVARSPERWAPNTEDETLKNTLFERIGGFAQVRLIVSDFYDRILDSENLRPYFQDIDVRRLIDHQTKFVSALMGGPASFSNEHLSRAHAHLNISPDEYEEMGEIFRETLEDFDVPPVEVERLHAHILSLREHVIGPSEEIGS
jgi:hemoglobin